MNKLHVSVILLEKLVCACINEMALTGKKREWADDSILAQAIRYLTTHDRYLTLSSPASFVSAQEWLELQNETRTQN